MPGIETRREAICRTAITLAARGGSHAVTHQAVDRELGIAKGSTSYYYRTRKALIGAVAERLAAESRAAFDDVLERMAGSPPDVVIDRYVTQLTTARRDSVRARLALLLDAECDPEHLGALAGCLFSRPAAVELCRGRGDKAPEREADRLLDELEGRVLRAVML